MADSGRDYNRAKHVSHITKSAVENKGQMQRPGQNSSSFLTFIRAFFHGAIWARLYGGDPVNIDKMNDLRTAVHSTASVLLRSAIKIAQKPSR